MTSIVETSVARMPAAVTPSAIMKIQMPVELLQTDMGAKSLAFHVWWVVTSLSHFSKLLLGVVMLLSLACPARVKLCCASLAALRRSHGTHVQNEMKPHPTATTVMPKLRASL